MNYFLIGIDSEEGNSQLSLSAEKNPYRTSLLMTEDGNLVHHYHLKIFNGPEV